MSLSRIRAALRGLRDARRAAFLRRYFARGPGDRFLGIRVPALRRLAKEHQGVALDEVEGLLRSPIHEERLLALLILVHRYGRSDASTKRAIYEMYLRNTRFINAWDLVDASAPHIVGAFLMHRSKEPLYRLARSRCLWERRISVVATFYFIKRGEFSETLKIAERLLSDEDDLIHKAVGWMLREVGKRHLPSLEGFLRKHGGRMPRTMLRYAIERFPESKRRRYLKGSARRSGQARPTGRGDQRG